MGKANWVKPKKYSTHSLRWGSTTQAFKSDIAEATIKIMGDWASLSTKSTYMYLLMTDLKHFINLLFNCRWISTAIARTSAIHYQRHQPIIHKIQDIGGIIQKYLNQVS